MPPTIVSDSVTVGIIAMQSGDLVIGGTSANDKIDFQDGTNTGDIEVILYGVSQGTFRRRFD